MKLSSFLCPLAAVVWVVCVPSLLGGGQSVPQPGPGHPGNIFLEGEAVVIPEAESGQHAWEAVDYENRTVSVGDFIDGRAHLGRLPAGYYEVRALGAAG